MKSNDIKYLELAIQNSKRSMNEGNFPAGAIVVKNGQIIASEVNSPYPGLFHADSKAVSSAFKKHGVLSGSVLYIGLQPCLMCTGVAYWAGIRKIVYAIPKSKVSGNYYETPDDTQKVFDTFNEKIEFIHIPKLERKALSIVKQWENIFLKKK